MTLMMTNRADTGHIPPQASPEVEAGTPARASRTACVGEEAHGVGGYTPAGPEQPPSGPRGPKRETQYPHGKLQLLEISALYLRAC